MVDTLARPGLIKIMTLTCQIVGLGRAMVVDMLLAHVGCQSADRPKVVPSHLFQRKKESRLSGGALRTAADR